MTVHLRYRVDGRPDGPTVVLGGSLGTTSAIWQPQMDALGETFRVVRYDHRGHGESPGGGHRYTIEDLGNDLIRLLDDLELASADLAGGSLGGMVAMWVAANAPTRVRRLALVCTSAQTRVRRLALVCTSAQLGPHLRRAELVRSGGMAAIADAVLNRWFTPGFLRRSPGVVAWTRGILMSIRAEEYAACCAVIEDMDLVPLLPQIVCPTLVIAGGQDQATPMAHAERIAAGIPLAELRVIPDAAHLANVEQPEAVGRLLKEFLGAASGEAR